MKPVHLLLIVVGALLSAAGLVFTLQGMGVVGPDYSSMFENSAWVYQGVAVMVVGLLTAAGGVVLSRKQTVRGH